MLLQTVLYIIGGIVLLLLIVGLVFLIHDLLYYRKKEK